MNRDGDFGDVGGVQYVVKCEFWGCLDGVVQSKNEGVGVVVFYQDMWEELVVYICCERVDLG